MKVQISTKFESCSYQFEIYKRVSKNHNIEIIKFISQHKNTERSLVFALNSVGFEAMRSGKYYFKIFPFPYDWYEYIFVSHGLKFSLRALYFWLFGRGWYFYNKDVKIKIDLQSYENYTHHLIVWIIFHYNMIRQFIIKTACLKDNQVHIFSNSINYK